MIDKKTLTHELTMLYLKNRNLSGFTPEELFDEYKSVYEEIRNHYNQKQGSDWLV